MITLVFLSVVALAVVFLAVPFFEGALSIALLTPLVALVIARLAGVIGLHLDSADYQPLLYTLSLLSVLVIAFFAYGKRKKKPDVSEVYPCAIFAVVFSTAFYVASRIWPDFIALGERLRDYSLVSSAIQSPVYAREMWMSGVSLNYYVYWYRFGAMLHALLGLEVWTTYHALIAMALALYSAVCFQVMRTIFGSGVVSALIAALLIPFGSNVCGMLFLTRTEAGAWAHDYGWWGASRVIGGAITEFPAWSFVLGDAHPHVLNLVTIPFLLLLLYRAISGSGNASRPGFQSLMVTVCGAMFLMGSNAWEVPMWLGCVAIVSALGWYWNTLGADSRQRLSFPYGLRPTLAMTCIWSLILISLRYNSYHIVPEAGAPAYVSDAISVTTTRELFAHWGAHLAALVLGAVLLSPVRVSTLVCGTFLAMSFAFSKAGGPLLVLSGVFLVGVFFRERVPANDRWQSAFLFGLIISGLGLVLIPEFVFLDDPYGGENERMNTIFKVYTAAWGMLGLASIALLSQAWRVTTAQVSRSWRIVRYSLMVSLALLAIGGTIRFYTHVVPQRVALSKKSETGEGLGRVYAEYAGAAEIIRTLRAYPQGRVLEAQGDPYSYTCFVSTLAGQPSYLGWQNHMNLLTRAYDEVTRRSQITDRFYGDVTCADRLALAEAEGVRYVVFGTLEQRRYPKLHLDDLSCLKQVAHEGEYYLFVIGEAS